LAQTPGNPEVRVWDDASETAPPTQSGEFPAVRFIGLNSAWIFFQRNCGRQDEHRCRFICSIDDDAEFSDPETVQGEPAVFRAAARWGGVGSLCDRHRDGSEHRTCRRFRDYADWLSNPFIGTAFAVRRDVFLQMREFSGAALSLGWKRVRFSQRYLGRYVVRWALVDDPHSPEGNRTVFRQVNRYIDRNGRSRFLA